MMLNFYRPTLEGTPEPPDLAALAQRMEAAAERMEQAAGAIADERRKLEEAAAPLLERLRETPAKGEQSGEGSTR